MTKLNSKLMNLRYISTLLFVVLFIALGSFYIAEATTISGTQDTAFSALLGTKGEGIGNWVNVAVIQSDQKYVIAGTFTTIDGLAFGKIARLNANGTPDLAFRTNTGTGFNENIEAIALQSDGKILVGGIFTTLNGVTTNRIARLNSNGTPDTTFNTNIGTGFNNQVDDIYVQGDGKILVAGSFTTVNGATSNRIARLNADGTPDTTFTANTGTGFNGVVRTISLQSDGKIIASGGFATLNGVSSNGIARLNSDGTPDTTFTTNIGTGFNSSVLSAYVLSDDKILVGGNFTTLNSATTTRIAKLHASGTPDTTFTTNTGTGLNDSVTTLAPLSDGKILVAGSFTTVNGATSNRMARLEQDGTPDTSFTSNLGTGFDSTVLTLIPQSDGKIFVMGSFANIDGFEMPYVTRLQETGTRDLSFSVIPTIGFNNAAQTLAMQSDGKIVVGGIFTTVRGVTTNRIARLSASGTPDMTFTTNVGSGFNNSVNSVRTQSDDKIIVGGSFTTVNGVTSNRIARLNASGTPDTTFTTNIGTGFGAAVNSVRVQTDGKIVVGGSFTTVNGVTSNRIARLNTDGTPDTTFTTNIGTGFNNAVVGTHIQSDGKILVAGSFTTVNGVTSNRIARLNASGTPDTTFTTNVGTGFNGAVNSVYEQTDGKIVVMGSFTTVNGVSSNRIARLNADGTPDTTFTTNVGTGFDSTVGSAVFLSDGKIVVGGAFTTLNGVGSNRIARLNASGTPDTTFTTNMGTGFDNVVSDMALDSEGHVVTAGYHVAFDTNYAVGVARIYAVEPPDVTGPVLSSITSSVTSDSVTVTWISSENATSTLEYGPTTSYGSVLTSSTATTTHQFTITGLTANTGYNFRIIVSDASGNVSTSSNQTTTTSLAPVTSSGGGSGGGGGGGGGSPVVPVATVTPATLNTPTASVPVAAIQLAEQKDVFTSANGTPFVFVRNLIPSVSVRTDVQKLQVFLNTVGFPVSTVGAGSPGRESTFFGSRTRAALAEFQRANGIRPALGNFGPITRAFVNNLIRNSIK